MKSKMSDVKIIAIALSAIFILPVVLIFFSGPINFFFHNHYSLNGWRNGKFSKKELYVDMMIPSIEECSGYKKAKFFWNNNESGSWIWDYAEYAACLEFQYEETTYFAAREEALSTYHFLENPALNLFDLEKDEITYLMPLTETTVGDYTVKVVDDRLYPDNPWGIFQDKETGKMIYNGFYTYYPSKFGFLAFNDKDFKIRYCYLRFYDLHVLEDEKSLKGYIKRNFPVGWK